VDFEFVAPVGVVDVAEREGRVTGVAENFDLADAAQAAVERV
jgi:hypothetical protein